MKEFLCTKCGSNDLFIKKSGNNTGLYCKDCGSFIKWLNKNELRIATIMFCKDYVEDDPMYALCIKIAHESPDVIVETITEKLGIPIFDDKGKCRSTYDILSDLSKLTDDQIKACFRS